jgi:hypothetical protein
LHRAKYYSWEKNIKTQKTDNIKKAKEGVSIAAN